MKHLSIAAAIALLPAGALAQRVEPAAPPSVDPRVATLRDAALKDDVAWDIVEGLTTEVGARPAGSDAEARARAWGVAKLKALGFEIVNDDISGAVQKDRKMLTGDSPLAGNALGLLAAKELLDTAKG